MRNALKWQEELLESRPEYRAVPLRMIDERREPEIARKYDYWFVPTYFLGELKLLRAYPEALRRGSLQARP